MRRLILASLALVLVAFAKLAAQTSFQTNYDAHIDQGGILHCINAGDKCVSW
jgi:hypothetical protein